MLKMINSWNKDSEYTWCVCLVTLDLLMLDRRTMWYIVQSDDRYCVTVLVERRNIINQQDSNWFTAFITLCDVICYELKKATSRIVKGIWPLYHLTWPGHVLILNLISLTQWLGRFSLVAAEIQKSHLLRFWIVGFTLRNCGVDISI